MDKKVLIAHLCLLGLAAGCMNDLTYVQRDNGPRIVMNSLMSAGEDAHKVYLSVSRPEKVDSLTGDANVSCYVNGELAGVATETSSDMPRQRLFVFSTPFSEGDRVRLEASAERYLARAEVSVPCKAELGKIDTLTVGDSTSRQLAFRIGMTDKEEGADYYSLDILYRASTEFFLGKVSLGTYSSCKRLSLDCSDDLILAEDNIAAANMGMDLDFGTPNRYGAFFDSQFDRSSVVLKPKVDVSEMWSFPENAPVIADSISVNPCIEVRISHIDIRHYYYLKAIGSLGEGSSSDMALEDVAIPDNIDGGIGFVGLGNPVSKTLQLPSYGVKLQFDEP